MKLLLKLLKKILITDFILLGNVLLATTMAATLDIMKKI